MALKNVPFRSEVLAWNSDNLADYFRKLNYRDCEKAVKKYHIDGARFLNLTENDIQKFPKLRMPLLSKLSQDINKNEERRSIFTQSHEEDDGGWSSFEDDYESPNDDDPDGEDDGDYESPNEEEQALVDDAADYEPPPSNNEEALQSSILPPNSFHNTNSMYIDRPPTGKVSQQPPVPPLRPKPALPPLPTGRNHSPLSPPHPNHEEPSRSGNNKTAKLPAPSIDRSTKPPLDRSLAPHDREPFILGKKPPFSDKVGCFSGLEHLPKIQKPPLPPAMDRHERNERLGPVTTRKPPVPRHGRGPDRRENVSVKLHQRPLPQPSLPSMSSNTFPSRSVQPSSKNTFPLAHMPGAFSESNIGFQQSASLPPYFSQGLYASDLCLTTCPWGYSVIVSRPFSKGSDFLSVSDIIDYFRKMPLLLIDGKNRGSRYQCTLTHAAGCL
uniref:SAM domain-containing protein n=1 Tax=Mus spicilegus TaxID=10103 RepID=A0A8C6HWD3_MUSSI